MSIFLSKQLIDGIFYQGIFGFWGDTKGNVGLFGKLESEWDNFYGFGLDVRVMGFKGIFLIEIWGKDSKAKGVL